MPTLAPDALTVRPAPTSPPQDASPVVELKLDEYIAFERNSSTKHHLQDGRLIEVAEASLEHNTICSNLMGEVISALRGTDCRAMQSDMKVEVSGSVAYYPDVVVCCGQPSITWGDVLQNPVLIAEVLSDTTEAFDRGKKFQQYRSLASLRHLLYIDQYRPFVEHWGKDDQGVWKLAGEYKALDTTLTLTIGDRDVTVVLSELYRFIVFAPDAEPAEDATDIAH